MENKQQISDALQKGLQLSVRANVKLDGTRLTSLRTEVSRCVGLSNGQAFLFVNAVAV